MFLFFHPWQRTWLYLLIHGYRTCPCVIVILKTVSLSAVLSPGMIPPNPAKTENFLYNQSIIKTLKAIHAQGPTEISKLHVLQVKILHVSTVGTNVILTNYCQYSIMLHLPVHPPSIARLGPRTFKFRGTVYCMCDHSKLKLRLHWHGTLWPGLCGAAPDRTGIQTECGRVQCSAEALN